MTTSGASAFAKAEVIDLHKQAHYEHASYEVDAEWENLGSHLHLNVALCIEDTVVDATQFFGEPYFHKVRTHVSFYFFTKK